MTTLVVPAQGLGARTGDPLMQAEPGCGSISDVFGLLKQEGRPALSIGEIGAVAAVCWAGERQTDAVGET